MTCPCALSRPLLTPSRSVATLPPMTNPLEKILDFILMAFVVCAVTFFVVRLFGSAILGMFGI